MDVSHDSWARSNGLFAQPLPFPPQEFQADIESAYRLSDEWIGRFLDETPADYAFVVVSDHGYDFDGTHHVYAPPGVVILSGGPFACGRLIEGADVYDIAPTLLALLGLPATSEMPGQPLEAAMGTRAPRLVRMDRYPSEWRLPSEETDAAASDRWDELRERLRAMGYAN
jgi:arylsulfatase A-like enzyme